MLRNKKTSCYIALFVSLIYWGCTPKITQKTVNKSVPEIYKNSQGASVVVDPQDTTNLAHINWKNYFTDPLMNSLIDTALEKNQHLNIMLQEINIAKNEIRARKGLYLPSIDLETGAGVEKVGRYTRHGAVDQTTNIQGGQEIPEVLPDYYLGATASWEIDIWRKLRNSKKAAVYNYLSSVEGRKFMITNLVAEIASSYYELMALDNQLDILKKNIEIQTNALRIVRMQKQAAKVTELAVRRFEAQVLNTQSLQYNIQQKIIETENRINFLLGRYPTPIERNSQAFTSLVPDTLYAGIPSQLMQNRLDIKQAELAIEAAKLDLKVAKANFYPSFNISAGMGYQAFNPNYLFHSPQSLMYSVTGGLVAPLVNRNGIKADYYNANAKQTQAIYDYERTVLNAYVEVSNQLSKVNNLGKSYDLKEKQVQALTESINISNELFISARADYMEVLLTQRDALESKMELIETKKDQINAMVEFYRALGGGWN